MSTKKKYKIEATQKQVKIKIFKEIKKNYFFIPPYKSDTKTIETQFRTNKKKTLNL
jgi:hypothetical protein